MAKAKKIPTLEECREQLMGMPLSALFLFPTTEDYGEPGTRGIWPWGGAPLDGTVSGYILDIRNMSVLASYSDSYNLGSHEMGGYSPTRELYDFWNRASHAAHGFHDIIRGKPEAYGQKNRVSHRLYMTPEAMKLLVDHPQTKAFFGQPGLHTVIRRENPESNRWRVTQWWEDPEVCERFTGQQPESSFTFNDRTMSPAKVGMLLTEANVLKLLQDCTIQSDEDVAAGQDVQWREENVVKMPTSRTMGSPPIFLHRQRVLQHREDILALLRQLPDDYKKLDRKDDVFATKYKTRGGIIWTEQRDVFLALENLAIVAKLGGIVPPEQAGNFLLGTPAFVFLDPDDVESDGDE